MFNLPRSQNRKAVIGASALLAILFLFFLRLNNISGSFSTLPVIYIDANTGNVLPNFDPQNPTHLKQIAQGAGAGGAKDVAEPIKDVVNEKEAALQQTMQGLPTSQDQQNLKPGDCPIPGERVKATFVSLARNLELYDLLPAIRNVEDRFNRKFHYDWIFLNDEPFSEEFKRVTGSIVSGTAKYGLVPKEHWGYPAWIDQEKAKKSRDDMEKARIIYGGSESYRHMCRYESGFFFRHPLMEEYDWYWRVEPGIKIHCDLDYDVFKFMEEKGKDYGFTITIHEFEKTIPTLWQHTKDFIKLHPEHVAQDNLMKFVSNDNGETYNLCHFWSNFEVASLKFLRSKAYMDYFEYLDKQGGFFYERWGDAPVHSIAVSLFMPKNKIHFFEDVGYTHAPYTQCPLNDKFRADHKCDCKPESDFTFRGYSCGNQYYNAMGIEKPVEWEHFQ